MVINKALIVGIDDYPMAPLSGCISDATEIAELLKENGDGSPNFDIKLELDISTKSQLLDSLYSLFSEGEADIALFYFSGHGTDELAGQIVTPDFNGRDFGISMNDILRMANTSKSKNKIIILDCCYSGKLGDFSAINSTDAIIGKGVTILTASNRDEVAIEDGITGHGVFTELLIQGLKGGAADVGGNITPASLYSFVDQSLGAWEQRPLFKTNITGFLPVRSVEAKVSKKVLRKLHKYFSEPNSEFKLDPSFEFTNTPDTFHEYKKPYANQQNVNKFKELQMYESVGLIEPVGEEHMYFAAMNSKTCRLTPLGLHYWKLSHNSRF
ncbi:caspase family protein [Lactococcus lactis subsp. lactis]|uniref:caspase family protein n=1 Tax=Lactococcus lactis TaxID=1358 RepID=UPI00223AC82B|nr:caspase family protein [Lactococcus lactis]MCT0016020.1 caspase family protein [Lactococcus lactis subsp. lactis]